MQGNKIPVFRRLGLGLIQHLAAALVLMLLAGLLFNAFLSVDTMSGHKSYYLDPLAQKTSFEESEVFQDLFQTSVQDIIHLAVIRDQMETRGVFAPEKIIDVTAFLSHYGDKDRDYGHVTVLYELENLIKWGRYGVEYKNRVMSLSDFVNYYGKVCQPENFALDGGGNLYFQGYASKAAKRENADGENQQRKLVEEKMEEYSTSQLEDMAFSYIMGMVGDGISVNREDDGNLTVYINTLTCRYQTVGQKSHLYESVDNWADFLVLQRNVAEVVLTLSENYELYQSCIGLYEEGHSNLKYVVRMRTAGGSRQTLSNVSNLATMDEENLTEAFANYRRYLIYYPDSLEFMGNTELDEGDIYEFMQKSHYPYPEEVYLWIALDTSYEAKGDAFYYANAVFERVIPYVTAILTAIVILVLIWLGIGLYLTVTAGVTISGEEQPEYYLNHFDRMWTEALTVLAAAFGYGVYRGYLYLIRIAEEYYDSCMELTQQTTQEIYLRYGIYALYGFFVSMFLGLFWYSFIRRIKVGNLYQDSLLHCILTGISRLFQMVLGHQNSVVSVLLPYNIFLLLNLFAVIGAFNLKGYLPKCLLFAAVIGLDTVIGMLLFKNSAEQNDIVDGINRIRSGESEYKLDVSKLHGTNRYLADAVNNIGEGIDNAVKTSMKDERLKTDLITNVSHDIKTPLTSIINYVDLLKRQDIQTEPARGYIQILESKSQRLKDLTDDLVEASKITSGNIELNLEALDMGELLQQTIGEFSEKLEDKGLSVVAQFGGAPAIICGDSRRMWRIMENLFNNICKYAMEGTRIYAQIAVEDGEVSLFLKNVSRAQMDIQTEELTERFIRGDSARSTEGSGLGLFIAKSLASVQGGTFEIQLDADLFKVRLSFPLYEAAPAEEKGGEDDGEDDYREDDREDDAGEESREERKKEHREEQKEESKEEPEKQEAEKKVSEKNDSEKNDSEKDA